MKQGRMKQHARRGLVVSHLERVSGEVFANRSEAITELAGNEHGIYALYKKNTLYYVGLARKLKDRVKNHLRDRHAGKWNIFSMYFVRSECHLKDLESLAIRIAYPKGNRVRGKFGGAADLRKKLQSKMLDSAREEINTLMGRIARPAKGESEPRSATARKAWRTRRKEGGNHVPVLKGVLADKALRMRYKGTEHRAWVNRSGSIRLIPSGEVFDSPSGAAKAIRKHESDGWFCWEFKNSRGEWQRLKELRRKR